MEPLEKLNKMDEFRLKKKIEALENPFVREILDEMTALVTGNLDYRNIKQYYVEKFNEVYARRLKKSSKWRQLDLEEAIENEKEERCACGKNKSCQCD